MSYHAQPDHPFPVFGYTCIYLGISEEIKIFLSGSGRYKIKEQCVLEVGGSFVCLLLLNVLNSQGKQRGCI